MSKEIPIRYGKWGVANHMGDYILLNEKLNQPQYKILKAAVLEHELNHSKGPYTKKDFINDIKGGGYENLIEVLFFLASTPRAWVQFSPLWMYEKNLYFDTHLFIMYGILGGATLLLLSIL